MISKVLVPGVQQSESVIHVHMHTQPSPTLCDPMDCSSPGSSVYGIFQARILEWVAISSPKGSFQPRDQTQVSHIAGRFFTPGEAPKEAKKKITENVNSIKIVMLLKYGCLLPKCCS